MIRMSKAATNASSSSGDDDNDSCNPQAAFKDGKPSNLELNKLAGKISAVWSTLGLHLGVGQNVLDTIEANEKAKAYRMLLRWKETTSSKALYRDLYYALCQEQVGLDNLAKEFCFVSAEGPSPPKRTKPEEIRLPAELSHSIAAHRSVEAVPTHHVMLSYQWNIKALVEKVYQGLRHLGINAWMDIHGGISGNINDSMAYGVEHAAVICCFMNGDYFSSKNCKKELNYADGLSKTIVPVMCEKGFKAQGWLGIITAGLLWIDFR